MSDIDGQVRVEMALSQKARKWPPPYFQGPKAEKPEKFKMKKKHFFPTEGWPQ